ncbi:MAG: hypothetical protein U0572_08950 [Phycisphaerales bacterium]
MANQTSGSTSASGAAARGVLVYTLHKSASMFVHRVTQEMTEAFGFDYYSINFDQYRDDIWKTSWKAFIESKPRSGCFGPIRSGAAEPIVPSNFEDYSVLLHLRDPRDVLVSRFFWQTYRLGKAPGGMNPKEEERETWDGAGIDEFVLGEAPEFQRRYHVLTSTFLGRPNVHLITYEQMVNAHGDWLRGFARAFEHRKSAAYAEDVCKRLVESHKGEFIQDEEDRYSHKRQIQPGDHQRKLKPQTIDRLNVEFAETLGHLGYR